MPDMVSIGQPQQRQFNPYSENGGTILAIAGANFSVIAGDTRQSEGYNIQTRYAPKVFRLYVSRVIVLDRDKRLNADYLCHLFTERTEQF